MPTQITARITVLLIKGAHQGSVATDLGADELGASHELSINGVKRIAVVLYH
jgi:hypothetical protein